jgi:hypothetical protein
MRKRIIFDPETRIISNVVLISDDTLEPNEKEADVDVDFYVGPDMIWDGEKAEYPPEPLVEVMSPTDFAERLGAVNMARLWAAATQSPEVAAFFAQGFTAKEIHRDIAYPALVNLEKIGVITKGTADAVWN